MSHYSVLVAAQDADDLYRKMLPYKIFTSQAEVSPDKLPYVVFFREVKASDFESEAARIMQEIETVQSLDQVDMDVFKQLHACGNTRAILERFTNITPEQLVNDADLPRAVAAIEQGLEQRCQETDFLSSLFKPLFDSGQFGAFCQQCHGGYFQAETGDLGFYTNPNGRWDSYGIGDRFSGLLRLKSIGRILAESESSLLTRFDGLRMLQLQQADSRQFEKILSTYPAEWAQLFRNSVEFPREFFPGQGVILAGEEEFCEKPLQKRSRASAAPAGLVDWAAVRAEVSEAARRDWDNWERALQLGGVTAHDYMDLLREFYRLPDDSYEQRDILRAQFKEIWAQIAEGYQIRQTAQAGCLNFFEIVAEQIPGVPVERLHDLGEQVLAHWHSSFRSISSFTPESALSTLVSALATNAPGNDLIVDYGQAAYEFSELLRLQVGEEAIRTLNMHLRTLEQVEHNSGQTFVGVDLISAQLFRPFSGTRAEHIDAAINFGFTWAFIDLEGKWQERSIYGFFGSGENPNAEYAKHFWDFVHSIPPTMTVFVVDCHV